MQRNILSLTTYSLTFTDTLKQHVTLLFIQDIIDLGNLHAHIHVCMYVSRFVTQSEL